MTLIVLPSVQTEIRRHAQEGYPEEVVGLILGHVAESRREASAYLRLPNQSPSSSRGRRYWIGPGEMMQAEAEAEKRGLEILGVAHSHPDHPAFPSESDREWALPWYVYLITSTSSGELGESRGWLLRQDRSGFDEEEVVVSAPSPWKRNQ